MSGYEKQHLPQRDLAARSEAEQAAPERGAGEVGPAHAHLWHGLGAAPETPEDAATLAVEKKGAGSPVDANIAGAVGAHMGADVTGARVHKDPLSRAATRAMGARAFAHGQDIFLGPGESEGDRELMGHELTHVAQQRGGTGVGPQRKTTIGAANSPAEAQADEVAKKVASGTAQASELIVDGGPLQPGQMLKSEFIAKLKPLVVAAANAELGMLGSAIGCPYIADYFQKYGAQPASTGEALIKKWIPAARGTVSAEALIPLVLDRVQSGVRVWKDTGKPPADLAAAEPAVAQAPAPATAQRQSLESVEAELGPGAPVDSSAAAQLSSAVGEDVSGARVHTGVTAQRMADAAGATAFAVGQNVVMGSKAPATGTIDHAALLAHELAHTAQQKSAAMDPAQRKKPIGEEEQAPEGNADLAALAGFAGKIGDVMRTGVQLQRCATEGPSGIDRLKYYDKYQAQIAATAAEHVRTLAFGTRDASAAWQGDGAKVFANRIGNDVAAPATPEDLESMVRPESIGSLIDRARVLDEDGAAKGPDKYFEAVGISVGNAIARRTTESLARVLPRYIQAKTGAGGAEPKLDDITVSHPIDPVVARALIATPSLVTIDQQQFAKLHPDLTGAIKKQTKTRNVVWEAVGGTSMWRRVKEPSDPTVEELAQAWLGSPLEAFRITRAHPLYGIAGDERVEIGGKDPSQELLAAGGDAADEAVLAQAGSAPRSTRSRERILEQMRNNASTLKTSIKTAAKRFGPAASPIDTAVARIEARAQRLSGADDATVAKWDKQVSDQAEVIAQAGKGVHADGLRLDMYATQFGADLKEDPGAFKLPGEHRKALFHDVELWVAALEVCDLLSTAREKMAVAAQHSAVLEIDILEQSLNTATQAGHHSEESETVTGDFDASTVSPREVALRKKLGQMRAQLYADPTKVDTKDAEATHEQTRDLVFESQVVLQATSLDQAWKALDDADGVLSTITFDSAELEAMKKEGKRYYADWQAVYALIKAGNKRQAREKFEQLASNKEFQNYLARVNALLKKVQKHHVIATIIAMVVITVVSMGAGSVLSGLVGGGSVAAGGATTAVSVGLGLGRTAGAVAGFVAETAVFSALAHYTFTKDRSIGGFLGEFAKTVVLFGAMRGIAAGFRAAGLEKIAEAGFKADATFTATVKAGGVRVGELILNGGVGVLEAVIEAKIREAMGGKQLTEGEVEEVVKQTVIQTLVMVLVARVAHSPLQALKIKAAFQGSKWRAALEGRAIEAKAVEGLQGGQPSADAVVTATKESEAQIKREIEALEELKTKADADPKALEGSGVTKEALGKQIDAMRGHQTRLAALELSFTAKEVGPNHFEVPRANIAEVLATHTKLQGKAPELVETNATTGARTWKITQKNGSEPIFIREAMPEWAITPGGKRVTSAARDAGMGDAEVFNLPQTQREALLAADEAMARNDGEGMKDALERSGLDAGFRAKFEAQLKVQQTAQKKAWVDHLRTELTPAQQRRLDLMTDGKSPAEIFEMFSGDSYIAKERIEGSNLPNDLIQVRRELGDTARTAFDAKWNAMVGGARKPADSTVKSFRGYLEALKRKHGELAKGLEEAATKLPASAKTTPPKANEFPDSWSRYDEANHAAFKERLEAFRGNDNLDHNFGGGEGAIFTSGTRDVALKRWYKSRLSDMAGSLKKLADARSSVGKDPNLAKHVDVVKVHEHTSDWILRDFVQDSVPIGDAGAVGQKVKAQVIETLKGKGELNATEKDILGKLERDSDNLHWSAERGKIIIIDMQ